MDPLQFLSATDLEIGIRTEIEGVETTAAGSVLLPSVRLMAIVRESPPGTTFEIETDGKCNGRQGRSKSIRLPAEDPVEFPHRWRHFLADACFELSTPLVRELVRRTVFATDNESSRYALGGVLLELTDAT
jgi:DNA polymerase-3 subunit beta